MCSWGLFVHMWLQMIIWGKGFWQATLFMLSVLCIKSTRYLSSDLLCGTLQRLMSCFQQILNSSCVKWAGWLDHVIHDISSRPKRDSQMLTREEFLLSLLTCWLPSLLVNSASGTCFLWVQVEWSLLFCDSWTTVCTALNPFDWVLWCWLPCLIFSSVTLVLGIHESEIK